jgi:LPS-assembly protein
MTAHYRNLLTGVLWSLLPLAGLHAQSDGAPSPWTQCEADELAQDLVPVTPNLPPPNELPIQAEAERAESSPAQSTLEGNVSLARGDQRLRADRIILDRAANRAKAENGFTYSDPQQVLRGQQAEVDLNTEAGWFQDADYYLPQRNAQGSAKEVQVNRAEQQSQLKEATYSTCARGNEMWKLRADEINLNEAEGRGTAHDIVLEFKDTPVFYFPYLSFPITDARQSGFLFPAPGLRQRNRL